ncbi:MAG: T9SS type A sorting domain-containing protein [Bacteroidetes bacterium]|nr:T9SS type A sorting domain-containing protein [Bacteroidota bacterium]
MKLYLLFLISLLFTFSITNAQNVQWATRAGSGGVDVIQKMVNDDAGNLYVLGYNSPSSQFGNLNVANEGQFFAKVDTNGNYVFVVQFDSSYIGSMSINDANQILITGATTGTDVSGTPVNFASSGISVGFAVLYDTSGTQLWMTPLDNYAFFNSPNNTYGTEFIISGCVPPNAVIGSFSFSNQEPQNYLASINTSGVITNAALIASSNSAQIPLIVADTSGNIYVTCSYFSNVTFSNGQTLTPNFGTDGYYVLKCDPAFNVVWSIHGQGFSEDNYFGGVGLMTVLSNQNVALGGGFIDSTLFGNDTIINYSVNDYTTFVISIDPNANIQWISLSDVYGPSMIKSVDSSGFYLAGTSENASSFSIGGIPFTVSPNHVAMYLVKFNNNGNALWGRSFETVHMNGSCCESIRDIVKGNSNEIYFAGFYYIEAVFDTITLPCYMNSGLCGPYEAFIAKLGNIPTGIQSINVAEAIVNIYPNPTNGWLQIEITNSTSLKSSITIYDILGQQIIQTSFSKSKFEIDLTEMKDGIYFVQIENNGIVYRKKVVKVKTGE